MVPHRFFAENCVPQLGLVLTDGLKTANMLYPCMRKRVLLVVREKTIHSNDFQGRISVAGTHLPLAPRSP